MHDITFSDTFKGVAGQYLSDRGILRLGTGLNAPFESTLVGYTTYSGVEKSEDVIAFTVKIIAWESLLLSISMQINPIVSVLFDKKCLSDDSWWNEIESIL